MNKPKRGQGLSALLSSIDTEFQENPKEVVSQLSSNVAEIPLVQIEVNPFQPRSDFDQEALKELSASIAVHGLIQPITVRRLENEKYQLISGERRMRASLMAGLKSVPAYVRVANDQEMLEMALVENIQRENLNSIEVATTYVRLKEECDLTDEVLADRVGKKRSTITNYLRLLKLPPTIQIGIREDKISMGHAKALLAVNDFGKQLAIYNDILAKGLSVRQVEALTSDKELPSSAKASKPGLPEVYQQIQDKLSSHFGTKIQIKKGEKGKGQIMIPFNSDKDFNRLLDLLEVQN